MLSLARTNESSGGNIMPKKMTKKQIEDDAYTISNYITLSSIEAELEDCRVAAGDPQTYYNGLDDVIKVLEKAVEVSS
jgi:hypothetical protein